MLTQEGMVRYSRQMLLIGKQGQIRLNDSSAAVIGAGGLGSIVLEYLVRAGLGMVRIIDGGKVELSNLNRQFYLDSDFGKPKAALAKERLSKVNPDVRVEAVEASLDEKNAAELLKNCNVVVDCLDSLRSRFILARACEVLAKPLVHGAVEGMRGYQKTCMPGEDYLSHLRAKMDKPGAIPIIGATAGIIGSLQALDVIKILSGKGKPNTKLFVFDAERNVADYAEIRPEQPAATQ